MNGVWFVIVDKLVLGSTVTVFLVRDSILLAPDGSANAISPVFMETVSWAEGSSNVNSLQLPFS